MDELSLTENSSHESVLQYEYVDPLASVKALYGNIRVNQDVTASMEGSGIMGYYGYGVVDSEDGRMLYEFDKNKERNWMDNDDTVAIGAEPGTFALSGFIRKLVQDEIQRTEGTEGINSKVEARIEQIWEDLIAGKEVSLKYFDKLAYGHGTVEKPVGYIKLTLEQETKTGPNGIKEKDLNESPHQAEVLGTTVEKYVLIARYVPKGPDNVDYKTGNWLERSEEVTEVQRSGLPTDEFSSRNVHTVDVVAPGVELPAAGGPGTHALALAGAALTAGAVLGLAWKRRAEP